MKKQITLLHFFKSTETSDLTVLKKCRKCLKKKDLRCFHRSNRKRNGVICIYCRTVLNYLNKGKTNIVNWFGITNDEFSALLLEPCFYCGINEDIGIDRFYNDIGYTTENCVSCCGTCNRMKNNLSDGMFFKTRCEEINKNMKEKFYM